jgi:hypothetical protein
MTPEHADAIEAAATQLGTEVAARHDYSGRGMYGRTTSGVTGKIPKILAAAALTAHMMDDDAAAVFVAELAHVSLDSMGLDSIVY